MQQWLSDFLKWIASLLAGQRKPVDVAHLTNAEAAKLFNFTPNAPNADDATKKAQDFVTGTVKARGGKKESSPK